MAQVSAPFFRGRTPLPQTNPLRAPSPLPPLPAPARPRGPGGAAQQGRESSRRFGLQRRSVRGLRARRKPGLGAGPGERELPGRCFPLQLPFQRGAPCPSPPLQFGARPPAQPPARPGPGFPSPGPLPGPGGWWTLPARTPPLGVSPGASREAREAKQPESPGERSGRRRPQPEWIRRKKWASAPPARMTPPPHQGSPRTAQSSAPTCLGASSRRAPLPWPPGSVLGDRDFLVQWRWVPGCPFFLAPARFPRASRSLSSRWSWRSAPAARQGASDPARAPRPAPRSTPPRGPQPAPAPRHRVGLRLLHLVCPGRRARGVLAALARIPSPPGWPAPRGFCVFAPKCE